MATTKSERDAWIAQVKLLNNYLNGTTYYFSKLPPNMNEETWSFNDATVIDFICKHLVEGDSKHTADHMRDCNEVWTRLRTDGRRIA